jgi:hypothetical protein
MVNVLPSFASLRTETILAPDAPVQEKCALMLLQELRSEKLKTHTPPGSRSTKPEWKLCALRTTAVFVLLVVFAAALSAAGFNGGMKRDGIRHETL